MDEVLLTTHANGPTIFSNLATVSQTRLPSILAQPATVTFKDPKSDLCAEIRICFRSLDK